MSEGAGKAVVTGAAGFIASHVADRLLAGGWSVVGVDNFNDYYDPAIKRENAAEIEAAGGRIVEADICDAAAMDALFDEEKPDLVVHLAARAGVRPSIEQPRLYSRVNVMGTTNLLDASARVGVKKFLLASSSSVYGNCPEAPFREDMSVDAPISPYAATKKACELLGHTTWHLHGLPVVCLRLFTVYGPRQRPDLAIHKFMRMIAAGEPIPVFGDGTTSRDYTYVSDIVDGFMAAAEWEGGFGVFNLGGSAPVTLSELIEMIEKTVGRDAVIDRQPMQAGDVSRTYADLGRSGAALGFSPKVTLAEGLAKQWAWLRERLGETSGSRG